MVMNSPRAIERSVDKFYTDALLPRPDCRRRRRSSAKSLDEAMAAVRDDGRRRHQADLRLDGTRARARQRSGYRPAASCARSSRCGRSSTCSGPSITAAATCACSSSADACSAPSSAWRRRGRLALERLARRDRARRSTLPPAWAALALRAAASRRRRLCRRRSAAVARRRRVRARGERHSRLAGAAGRRPDLDVAGAHRRSSRDSQIRGGRPRRRSSRRDVSGDARSPADVRIGRLADRHGRAARLPARGVSAEAGQRVAGTTLRRHGVRGLPRQRRRDRSGRCGRRRRGPSARRSGTPSRRRRAGRAPTPISASCCCWRRWRARHSRRGVHGDAGVRGSAQPSAATRCCARRSRDVLDEHDRRRCARRVRGDSAGARRADSDVRTEQDVAGEPTLSLLEVDAPGRRTATRSHGSTPPASRSTFETRRAGARRARAQDGLSWDDAIVETFLTLLAARPDTHVARRAGRALAAEVSRRAAAALAAGGVRTAGGRRTIDEMDRGASRARQPRQSRVRPPISRRRRSSSCCCGGWASASGPASA